MSIKSEIYNRAYREALQMLNGAHDSLSPRDALKECGNHNGINWGDDMGAFVDWAERKMGLKGGAQ